MDWDTYQAWALTKFNRDGNPRELICNAALGLCGEVGELVEKIKKQQFHQKPSTLTEYKKEGGDILYYLAVIMALACIPLSQVMEGNVAKLNARYPKGFDPSRAQPHGHTPIEESGESPSSDKWPHSPGEDLPEVLT